MCQKAGQICYMFSRTKSPQRQNFPPNTKISHESHHHITPFPHNCRYHIWCLEMWLSEWNSIICFLQDKISIHSQLNINYGFKHEILMELQINPSPKEFIMTTSITNDLQIKNLFFINFPSFGIKSIYSLYNSPNLFLISIKGSHTLE